MLINVDITDAIFIQFQIGLVLAFMISMPYLVHVVGQFLAPALKGRETRLLKRVSLPATLLFILGCAFSYYWITPWTLHFLYGYVFAMDIAPFLSVTSFVNFVLLFVLAFGIVFELPIIMVGITSLGIVDAAFWARHWRWAAVACFVFGAVITPDGSGITMIMVALPMLGLYGAGYAVSRLVQKRPTAAGTSSKKTRAKRMAPKPAKGEVPEGS